MANKNRTQDVQLRLHLKQRLEKLQQKSSDLQKQLDEKFSTEVFRQLNITENSIECCERRLSGKFTDDRGEFEQTMPVKSKTFHY